MVGLLFRGFLYRGRIRLRLRGIAAAEIERGPERANEQEGKDHVPHSAWIVAHDAPGWPPTCCGTNAAQGACNPSHRKDLRSPAAYQVQAESGELRAES